MKKNDDSCKIFQTNEKVVKEVKSSMLTNDEFYSLSNNFRVISDPTRLKIVYALSRKELCVCELFKVLEMKQSAVSHQLRILKDSNLVKFRKKGKLIYYSLIDNHILRLLEIGVKHAKE